MRFGSRAQSLWNMTSKLRIEISYLENAIINMVHSTGKEQMNEIMIAKRHAVAFEGLLNEVFSLLSSNDVSHLMSARELMRSPLEVPCDAVKRTYWFG